MTISLRLEDKMNRQLSCVVEDGEGAAALTDELVRYGFISQVSASLFALTFKNLENFIPNIVLLLRPFVF